MKEQEVIVNEIDSTYESLDRETRAAGYHLNPDVGFTKSLVKSLIINNRRYGYWACPCRLASGNKHDDLDIICPCDYRDLDLNDYGTCYCALYVSEAFWKGDKKIASIPDRRPSPWERKKRVRVKSIKMAGLSLPVWRCKVCGYLCAREQPPEVCRF